MTIELNINNKSYTIAAEPDMPLLWALRDILDLTGTKYGCGIAVCGACTVLVNNRALRSCTVTVQSCVGQSITTIEGLSTDGTHPIQKAWEEMNVPQCGYCQAGQMMTLAGLLEQNKKPTEAQINSVMSQVICRCGTYHRIRKAINLAIEDINK
jgi:isoquinoline 1-oxidoreductase subunit alpha